MKIWIYQNTHIILQSLCIIILTIFTLPTNLLIHEYAHYIIIKHTLKKHNLHTFITLSSLSISQEGFKATTTCTSLNQKTNLIHQLKSNKNFKDIILIYKAGKNAQIIFIILLCSLALIFSDYIPILYSIIFISIHTIYTFITYLFTGGNERDRLQIKKYKKLYKNKNQKKLNLK